MRSPIVAIFPLSTDVSAFCRFIYPPQPFSKSLVESEPGVYRRTERTGEGFTAFELTALLPGTGFDIHVAKMAD
jgi:ribosomal protein L13E